MWFDVYPLWQWVEYCKDVTVLYTVFEPHTGCLALAGQQVYFPMFFTSSQQSSILLGGVILPFLLGQIASTTFVDLKVIKSLVNRAKVEET